MERFFAASQNSPLQMLRMLENNLKRERRIFAMAVALLIFAALCGAAATGVFVLSAGLKADQDAVQTAMRGINVSVFSRYNILTPGSLLLNVGAVASSSDVPDLANKPRCQAYPPDRQDAGLATACDAARQLIPEESTPPVLQYVSYDGAASHGFGFFDKTDNKVAPAQRLSALVSFAKIYMSTHRIAPLDAARARRVMWFIAPPSLGFLKPTVVLFMVVARNDQPLGLVFTTLGPDAALRRVTSSTLESQIAVFAADGHILGGDDTEYTRYANAHLTGKETGTFHWLPGRGWGIRLEPLALGIGYIVAALPLGKRLASQRDPVIVIALVTAALIAMLIAMYRYWNYRFLTRTYEQACRAVEGEILNHLLVHATPVGLCIAMRGDFAIIAANQVARSVLDLTDASLRLPAGLCQALQANGIAPAREGQEAMIRQLQYSHEKADAATMHLKISYASAVVNKTDVLFCAIADISEHYEAERLLRAATETSDAAAKAKLSFFASMSHEIRTPLSSLVGNLELVALGPLAAEQEARVHAMQASASALLQVVNDVLDFSKMDIGEMRLAEEWGSIRELLVRVIIAHAPLANRQGLRLYVVIDRSCPAKLLFDPIRVSQILNNLLGNALKFTYSGKVVVRARWAESALELSVADSGIGIPESQRDKLFQPFMQGDAHRLTQARGTGLGLSICVRLSQLMKGRIELDSTEGVGTRIRVSLPLAVDVSASAGSDAVLPGGRPAILCRANEYREWLGNLYDPDRSSLTFMQQPGAASTEGCDYLIATDEFSDEEIQSAWNNPARVIRMTQNGPLVPVQRENGVLEVSIFSVKGFRDAVGIIRERERGVTLPGAGTGTALPVTRTAGPTVVVAEDNRLNRGLLRDQLLTLGATVLEAADGEEALDLLRKNRVDLVLTDMDMPKMSGAELLVAARALDPAMRVYAVSASASTQDVEAGRARGFTDYLTKPLPLSVLAGVLRTARADDAGQPDTPRCDDAGDDDLPPRFPTIPAAYMRDLVAQIDEDIVALDRISRRKDVQQLRSWAHKLAGGLTVLGPSMLYDQCDELRTVLRESGQWVEDVDTFTALLRGDLIELRDMLHAALQAQSS